MLPPVNGLCLGATLTNIELLTIKSFLDHGHRFVLWAYDDIVTPLPLGCKINNAGDILKRQHTSTFAHSWEFKFLYEIGGWYSDLDICCLQPFTFSNDIVIRQNQFNGDPTPNLIRLPAKTQFAIECFETLHRLVTKEQNVNLAYAVFGYEVANHSLQRFFAPYEWFGNSYPNILVADDTPLDWSYALHWGNERIREQIVPLNSAASLSGMLLRRHGVRNA